MCSTVFVKRVREHQECFTPYLLQHTRVPSSLECWGLRGCGGTEKPGGQARRKKQHIPCPTLHVSAPPLVPTGSSCYQNPDCLSPAPLHCLQRSSQEYSSRAMPSLPVERGALVLESDSLRAETFTVNMIWTCLFISPNLKFFISKVGIIIPNFVFVKITWNNTCSFLGPWSHTLRALTKRNIADIAVIFLYNQWNLVLHSLKHLGVWFETKTSANGTFKI